MDFANLVIGVDSTQVSGGERALDRLTGAAGRAETAADRHARATVRSAAAQREAASVSSLYAAALASAGVALAGREVLSATDAYIRFTNQLKVAGLEGERLAVVQDKLFGIAQKYGVEMEGLGNLYGRLSQASKDLGADQNELERFATTVAAAIKVQGSTAAASRGALIQLTQALGGAIVRAEEFNSMNEGARPLLQAVANGIDRFGGSVSKLRSEVIKGKVSSKEFFEGALKGSADLEARAAKANLTIAASFQTLDNALAMYFGRANEANGATNILAQSIAGLNDNLDVLVPAVLGVIGVIGARWAAAGAQFVATEVGRGIALGATITAEKAAAVSAAQLEVIRTGARIAELEGTAAYVLATQQQVNADLKSANAKLANAQAVRAMLGANGPYLASASSVAAAETAVANATRARAVAMADLALLGRQQTLLNSQLAGSSVAAAAATDRLTQAQMRAGAGMTALRGAGSGLLALVGGPWGAAFIGLGAAIYLVSERNRQFEASLETLRSDIAGTGKANDEYKAALDRLSISTDKSRAAAIGEANAMRVNAAAKLQAATATRELALAQAQLARDQADRIAQTSSLRTRFGAYEAGVDPSMSAFEGQIPDILVGEKAENATRRATATTEAYTKAALDKAEADTRYAEILRGFNTPAVNANTAATGKGTKAKQDAKDETESYIDRLREETEEIGKNAKQIRALETLRAVAKAKSPKDKQTILDLAAEKEARIDAAEALEFQNKIIMDGITKSVQQTTAVENLIKQQEFELSLIGKTIEEKARLTAIRDLETQGIKVSDAAMQGLIKTYTANAAKLAQGDAFDVKKMAAYLEVLEQIDDAAQKAAQGMENSFGRVGKAVGGLMTTLTGYARNQASIQSQLAVALEKYGKDSVEGKQAELLAGRRMAQAEIQNYGDMASAAKGFFNEKSTGYKVLEGVEKAFRAVEMAMALRSMVIDAMSTASSVKNSGIRAAADGVAAFAKTLASLPFPFNIAAGAAVVGALAAVGVKLAGGGGKGVSAGPTPEQMQEKQGTGSVLGDAAAKSESLLKATEIVAKNTNKDLEYSNDMLKAMRSIDDKIGAVATLLARELSVGGAYDNSMVGASASGNFLFSSSKKTEIQDQGIQFSGQTVAEIIANGITGELYQTILTSTKKKLFGITLSNKTKSSTTTTGLDDDFSDTVGSLIASLKAGIVTAAEVLGVVGAEAALDSFTVNLGKISFEGMTGAEIQDELNAIFGKLGDDMASTALPFITSLQKVGEGAFETLARVAKGYQVVDVALQSIGKVFGAVGVDSLAARERLLDFVGGIDEFVEQTSFFQENFLTEAERMAPIMSAVTAEMTRLGLASVDTKTEFRDTVLGLDLTTEAGAKMYAALMAVAPAFLKATEYVDSLTTATNDNSAELERQKEIASTKHDLDIELLEALGKSEEVIAIRRKEELDALMLLDPALAALKQQIYDAQDAATIAAAKAANDNNILKTKRQLEIEYMEVTGDTLGATNARRQDELAALFALDPALAQMQQRIYDTIDANAVAAAAREAEEAEVARQTQIATTRRGLEIQLMEALGNSSGALAARRYDELAALALLDPALVSIQQAIYDATDAAVLAAEQQRIQEAADRAAEQLAATQQREAEQEAERRQREAEERQREYEQRVNDARQAVTDAYDREADALQTVIDKFQSFADSLRAFRQSLETGSLAVLGPEDQYFATKALFTDTARKAAAGDEAAIGALQSVSEEFLAASQGYYSVSAAYYDDLASVKSAVLAAEQYALTQVNASQAQLARLDAMVSGITQLNQNVLTLAQAIAQWNAVGPSPNANPLVSPSTSLPPVAPTTVLSMEQIALAISALQKQMELANAQQIAGILEQISALNQLLGAMEEANRVSQRYAMAS